MKQIQCFLMRVLCFFLCAFLCVTLCSCASMFAEKTEVEVYNPLTGNLMGRVFSNKGYTDFRCKARLNENGTGEVEWTASKVNSDTVAQTALEANKELSGTFGALIKAGGYATGIPLQ